MFCFLISLLPLLLSSSQSPPSLAEVVRLLHRALGPSSSSLGRGSLSLGRSHVVVVVVVVGEGWEMMLGDAMPVLACTQYRYINAFSALLVPGMAAWVTQGYPIN